MAGHPKPLNPELSPRHLFGAELRRWRVLRGLSQRRLAERVLHSEETVSKVERAERWPSQALAHACDGVLHANGALIAIWDPVERQRIACDGRYRRRDSSDRTTTHGPRGGQGHE